MIHQHIVPLKVYFGVFAGLMLLMAATIGAAFMNFDDVLSGLGFGIAIAIALAKMLLIILYFMHIRYSGKVMWVTAATGFFFMMIFIVLTLGDYIARVHTLTPSTHAVPFDRMF